MEGENRKRLYINAYYVTRHYGGPEEGGWWYDAGRMAAQIPIEVDFKDQSSDDGQYCGLFQNMTNKSEIRVIDYVINHLYDTLGSDAWGSISSVNGGMEIRVALEDHEAESYPAERPHYE